ncbi:MAG: PLP-dependent aminotransferase family protein [Pirellulales bacterium]|nr:PLP-dependent aminotransferase family protein [Pirellulales bacterium]
MASDIAQQFAVEDVPPAFETVLSQRARRAEGQPISQLMSQALANPDLISLAAGFVDQATLPVEETAEALDAIMSDEDAAQRSLQYGTTVGYAPLRDAILERHREADGEPATERDLTIDNVVMTAGSNQFLCLLTDSLTDPGDIVLCSSPSYFVYIGALANIGARAVGIETDDDGIVPASLEAALAFYDAAGELHRVKAIYVCTYYDNPGSVTTSVERRAEIVEIAKRWSKGGRIYVIEDAAYRELRYAGEDVPSMRSFDEEGDTVVVAGTFSKSYSPGIRVGWGIVPRQLVQPTLDQKSNLDFGSPNFAQHLMHEVLARGLFERHVHRLRENYAQKLAAMLEAADASLAPIGDVKWVRPTGGLYVWLSLPDGVDTGASGRLFELATERGVLYVPGEYCFPNEGRHVEKNHIRLSFGVQSPENIRRGVEALGDAIRQVV